MRCAWSQLSSPRTLNCRMSASPAGLGQAVQVVASTERSPQAALRSTTPRTATSAAVMPAVRPIASYSRRRDAAALEQRQPDEITEIGRDEGASFESAHSVTRQQDRHRDQGDDSQDEEVGCDHLVRDLKVGRGRQDGYAEDEGDVVDG